MHYEKWDIAAVSSCSEMCPLIVMNEFFFGPHELELACWEITSHKKIVLLLFPWKKLLYEVVNTFSSENSIHTVGTIPRIEPCTYFHVVNAQ